MPSFWPFCQASGFGGRGGRGWKCILSTIVTHRHWLRPSAAACTYTLLDSPRPVRASTFLEYHRNRSRSPDPPSSPNFPFVSHAWDKKVGGPRRGRVSLKPGTCPFMTSRSALGRPCIFHVPASLPGTEEGGRTYARKGRIRHAFSVENGLSPETGEIWGATSDVARPPSFGAPCLP